MSACSRQRKPLLRFHRSVLLAIVLIVVTAACASLRGPLDDTRWQLAGWSLSSLSAGEFAITATFSDGRIAGSSGVNTYRGSYTLGPGDAFAVGSLVSTEMAGPQPAMRAEHAYMTLLGQAKSWRTAAGRLTLYDQGGNESLIFETSDR